MIIGRCDAQCRDVALQRLYDDSLIVLFFVDKITNSGEWLLR